MGERRWMRPGRLELQEKGPEQKHIWMSQGLWVECISSWGGGCTGPCTLCCWLRIWTPAASLSLSSTSLPVTLPALGSLNVRDAKAGELSQCGLSKQDNQSSRAEGRHPRSTGALCSPTVQTRLEPLLSHIQTSFQDMCFVRAPEVSSNA